MKPMKMFVMISGAMIFAASLMHCDKSGNIVDPNDMTVIPDLTTFPPPAVSAIAPAVGVNNMSTGLTISGTGFLSGASVTVGGQPCTNPRVNSATSITCTVPARPASCGPQNVVVTNPDQQSAMSIRPFLYRSSSLAFGATLNLPSQDANNVVAVDLNKDGYLDLVNTNRGAGNVHVFLNNKMGGFSAATPFSTGANPIGIAAGDVNGDGKQDIVTANLGDNSFSVLLGDGNGGLMAKTDIPLVGLSQPHGIGIVDVNRDGKSDVVVTLYGSGVVAVRLGDGMGGFGGVQPANVPVGALPVFIAFGDINGDGNLDFAVPCNSGNEVSIRTGDGKGAFTGSTGLAATFAQQASFADFNGDGKLDVVATAFNSGTLMLFPGNGNGTFGAAMTTVSGGTNTIGLAAKDVDLDGVPDVTIACNNEGAAAVLRGSGMGTFMAAAGSPYTMGTQPFGVEVADLNNDGLPDIVTGNSAAKTVSVRFQTCK